MLINIVAIFYGLFIISQQCSGMHFVELPGFDSDEIDSNKKESFRRMFGDGEYNSNEPHDTEEFIMLERVVSPTPIIKHPRINSRHNLGPKHASPSFRAGPSKYNRNDPLFDDNHEIEPKIEYPTTKVRSTTKDRRYPFLDYQHNIEPNYQSPVKNRAATKLKKDSLSGGYHQIEPKNIYPKIKFRSTAKDRKYSYLDEYHQLEPKNVYVSVKSTAKKRKYAAHDYQHQLETKNEFSLVRAESTTNSVQDVRRHWLVSGGPKENTALPTTNMNDKDASLKNKISTLVQQTMHDTELRIKSVQAMKERHRDKAPYKIGFILSMVKKSRDVLNELFNVAVKHREEWRALEQLKIFELIVHTNVDTTNLVRQLVEIHIQHLNSTNIKSDSDNNDNQRKRVVLL